MRLTSIFDKAYAREVGNTQGDHAYLPPETFEADTPCGHYKGVTDQVKMSATPGFLNSPLCLGDQVSLNGWLDNTVTSSRPMNTSDNGIPRVVIVGGGFGGLAAAKALRRAPVRITLIDRTNHHLFQPLLYQVATSVLAPGQISAPIRGILGKQSNTTVIMAEVTGVNKEERHVLANSADRSQVQIPYDYLILATGQRHSYFGTMNSNASHPG